VNASAKYLARYAESHIEDQLPVDNYSAAIVIPAFNESPSAILTIHAQAVAAGALLIVVVNYPEHTSLAEIAHTRSLLETLTSVNSRHLLVLDGMDSPLPRQQGVGLARKIGTDIALRLYHANQLTSPWLYMTDADVMLPANYFSHPLDGSGAYVFAHRHRTDDHTVRRAINLYDQHMAYYIAGLTFAGSRHAYPTLGSTIAVHAETYAQVRGFPRKNAGEDFYLLNKIVKIAPVRYCPQVLVTVTARLSQRVPFGTGPALEKISELLVGESSGASYMSYNFNAFELLREALGALNQFATTGQFSAPKPINDILNTLGWQQREALFRTRYQPKQRREAVLDWFDGLKTLKFIHATRLLFPDLPLLETFSVLPSSVLATIASHYLCEANHT
jgi:hypothetical protein